MFPETKLDKSEAIFVFGFSALTPVVNDHYTETTNKKILRKVISCRIHDMHQNFCVASPVLGLLCQAYPDREGIVNAIRGMLHEEAIYIKNHAEATNKLAQLKKLSGQDIYVITTDSGEIEMARETNVITLTPDEALKKIEEISQKKNGVVKK